MSTETGSNNGSKNLWDLATFVELLIRYCTYVMSHKHNVYAALCTNTFFLPEQTQAIIIFVSCLVFVF